MTEALHRVRRRWQTTTCYMSWLLLHENLLPGRWRHPVRILWTSGRWRRGLRKQAAAVEDVRPHLRCHVWRAIAAGPTDRLSATVERRYPAALVAVIEHCAIGLRLNNVFGVVRVGQNDDKSDDDKSGGCFATRG